MEDDVTIGHNATVHACTLRKGCLVGMGATVLDGADVGEGAIIAAGALVLGGTKVGAHEIWGGVPAKFIKKAPVGKAEAYAAHYAQYAADYLKEKD
jgi:carbonic anhydrase/acetyltransferase-like protein (isoleucine patch superfamily)